MKASLFGLIFQALIITSCSKISNNNNLLPNDSIPLGTITANVNGIRITDTGATESVEISRPNGVNGYNEVIFITSKVFNMSTQYESSSFTDVINTPLNTPYILDYASYLEIPDSVIYLIGNSPLSDIVTFTSITDSTMRGTFGGLLSGNNYTITDNITIGQFYLKYIAY